MNGRGVSDFQCPYADPGRTRCPNGLCDCFIDLYPDDPFGLHPEVFAVGQTSEVRGLAEMRDDLARGDEDAERGAEA